jgi:hypothetical protein
MRSYASVPLAQSRSRATLFALTIVFSLPDIPIRSAQWLANLAAKRQGHVGRGRSAVLPSDSDGSLDGRLFSLFEPEQQDRGHHG